jgi:glucose-1-phosphate cytidylyltransferase
MNNKDIPIVILAGGNKIEFSNKGLIPKAIIRINDVPILFLIIEHYYQHGFRKFLIATGSGTEIITNAMPLLEIYLGKKIHSEIQTEIIFTGSLSETGSRIYKLKERLASHDIFGISYCDTISDINISKLLSFHIENRAIVSIAAVRIPTRFKILGLIDSDNRVKGFTEKAIIDKNYVNGGFYFMSSEIFKFKYDNYNTSFESDILPQIIKENKLYSYRYDGFWQYVDSKRDACTVEKFYKNNKIK